MKKAVIAGASGLIGGFCLQRLLHSSAYDQVVAVGRRPLGIHHPKLKQITVDFENLAPAFADVAPTDAFCCLGTTIKKAGSKDSFAKVDHEYPYNFARAALMRGAKQFLIVTAMGADTRSSVFYNQVKGYVEADVRKLGFPSLHIFRPSLLTGPRHEVRTAERAATAVMSVINPILVGPLAKFRSIPAEVVAQAMIDAAAQAHPGVHIHLSDEIHRLGSN